MLNNTLTKQGGPSTKIDDSLKGVVSGAHRVFSFKETKLIFSR